MGKYDDAIGGGKIIVDVEEILNEEAADKVDKKIKTQKAELEKPIKVTVEIDDKSIGKLKQLTEAVKKNSDNLQQAMQSGRNISELSDYIQTHKQLERQIKAVTKGVKSNNTEVSKSKQVLIDAQNIIDQISISIEKNNRIDYLDKTVKGATQAVSAISKFQQLLGDLGKKYGEATFSSIFGGVVSSFKAIDESNASQVYDALIAKDREYQSQLEEENKVRERITQEVKAYAEATKYIYKNGEPSQDILNAYASYWEKVSTGAMSAADAVKAFEEEWNQLGGAVDYQQKQQIDEIRSLIRNQKEWLKYLEQSLNSDNFKTSGKKEATQKLRDLTSRLIYARKNNYQDDAGNQYNRQMIEVAWAQGYKEAQRQNVAQSTLTRYHTDALYSYDDNLKVLQDAYDFRKKLLAQYEEELEKIGQITSEIEEQKEAKNDIMPSSQAITSMSQLGEVLDAVRVKYRELKGEMSDASFKMLEAHVSRAKTALEELNDVAVLSKLRESIDKAVNIKAWYDLLHIPQTIQKGFSNIDDFDQTVEDQFRISIEGVPYASEWDIAFLKTLEKIGIQETKGEKMPVFSTRASRLMTLFTEEDKKTLGFTDRNLLATKGDLDDDVRRALEGFSINYPSAVHTEFNADLDSVTVYMQGISELITKLTKLNAVYPAAQKRHDEFLDTLHAEGAIGSITTLEQLQAVVDQFPEAQQYIDKIQSRIQKPVVQQPIETTPAPIQEETKAIKSWTGEAVRHLDILNLKARTLKKELKDIRDYALEEQREMGSVFNDDTGASIEIVYSDGGSALLMDGLATRWDASGQKILDNQQIGSYTETTTDEQTGKEIIRRIRGMTKKAVEDLFKNVVYAIYSDGYGEFDTQIGDLAPYHIDASEGRLWNTYMDYMDIYKSRVKVLHGDLMDLKYEQKAIADGSYDENTKLIQQYESLIDNVELTNRLYSEQADILDKIEAKESELEAIRADRDGLDDKIHSWESDEKDLLWREALMQSAEEEKKIMQELVHLSQQYESIQLPSKEKPSRTLYDGSNIEQIQSNIEFQKRQRDQIKLEIDTKAHVSEIKSLEQINSELEQINQQYSEIWEKQRSYKYDSSEYKELERSLEPLSIQRRVLEARSKELLDARTTPDEFEKAKEQLSVEQRVTNDVETVASSTISQLTQGIQQIGNAAEQTTQQLEQQTVANETLASSSEQATQQVEQQATITERSASPSQTPNVLPALTVPERIATIGNGTIDNLLKDYNITNPEAQSEVVNAFDEMARIIKAVFDKAKVEGPVSNKDNLFVRLQESADKASSLIIQLGTEARDTSESLDGLRDFYSFMKGKKIQYNNSIKAEYGDGWGKFYNRFKNYLTPSPTAETAGSLYKHLSGEASDGTGLPNANIDVFRQFFPQDLGDDIHQFARIFEVLGNALDASNGGRSWKKIDKIPLRNTSNENKQDIRGQVQDIQIGMIQTLKQMTDASAEALRNEEQLVEGERAVGDAVRNTNEARREGNEEQRKAIQDVGDASENERQSIIERDETRALEVLRNAKNNKTNLVDLSGVYSTDDLKSQLESMASTVTSKENLLSVGSVHIQDNIASVTMYNEALGITYRQLYEVSKAAEDAEESQLKLWSESYDENYKAAQKYSEAQKKKIAQDDSWLIGQASKLNTQERKYKYAKKIDGTTALIDADETSLAEGADRTIDSLATHIKNKIQSAMGQGLTNEIRNEIANDLRILDNEIKIEQYKQYSSTTMKPSELKSAKDELEYTLQSLEAKAKKNNVFSQIEQDVISLRSQLKGVADGTQLSKFIDDLRVIKSKLNAEIAKEQTTKKEEQNYQNLINLQNRLYEAKKKLNDLEIKGQSDTAEGQQASRKVQELQNQYDLSVKLLQNEEHRRAIEDRGAGLDSQLNIAKDQKQIEQYYQNIFDIVQRVNNLDSQINTFKMKDGGKGIYSDLIASLESEKATLLGKINQIGADVNQYFNGVFASVGDVEKVQLPFNSLLKDTSAYSTILDFLNSVDVRATLGAEAVNKLVQAFYNSSQAGSEFVGKISAQFKPAEEAFARLQQIISSGGLNVDNDGTYQQMKQRFDALQQLSQTDMSKWSAEDIAYFTNLAKSVAEYANNLSKAAEQEANYFAGKTKAYAGDTMYGNPQKNEFMVVDQPDKNIDTARQKLEQYVAAFTEGKGIITDFTTAANGISQITFSALDKGTGQFRTFTAEMGRCTDNIYRTETTLNGLASGTNAAKKSIASLATVMSQLNGVSGAEEQLKALWEVYQNLQNAINNKGNSQNVDDQNMLKNMATDADKARKEVEKLIKEWAKAQAGLDDGSLTPLKSIDKNGNIKEQMWERIKTSTDEARASFVDFDEKTNTLTYTLTNADKTVTTMTAHMYGLNGAVTAQQGKTEKLKTGWQGLTGALSGALKGVGQYLGRAFSMWAIVGQLKQGFNAVKQIDAALTELKKVTDETEGSYQRFLNTASQTAGKIGSTVSDFTQASANFARLGYTMEESAKMAETAIVYKNVAD